MKYLNVDLLGLSGYCHPAIRNITNTRDVPKLRSHLKFLTGDYLTYSRLAYDRQGGNPGCRLCPADFEDIEHVLTICRGTADIRERLLPDLLNTISKLDPTCRILDQSTLTPHTLTQFLLDCGSPNLTADYHIGYHNPDISDIFKISRDWCYAVSSERKRLLKELKLDDEY